MGPSLFYGCNYSTGLGRRIFRAPQATGPGFNCKLCTPSVTFPLEEKNNVTLGQVILSVVMVITGYPANFHTIHVEEGWSWGHFSRGPWYPLWLSLCLVYPLPYNIIICISTIKLMILSLGSRCPLHRVKSPLNWFDIRNKGLLKFFPQKTTFFRPSVVPSMAAHPKGAELPYQTHPAHKCGAVSDLSLISETTLLWHLRRNFTNSITIKIKTSSLIAYKQYIKLHHTLSTLLEKNVLSKYWCLVTQRHRFTMNKALGALRRLMFALR